VDRIGTRHLQFLMVAFLSLYAGCCPAAYAELFPTRVHWVVAWTMSAERYDK